MKNRGLMLVSAGVVLLLAAISFYVGQGLPADARVPIHWNAAGQIDGYASAGRGLAVAPLIALLSSLILAFVSIAEPQRDNLAKSRAVLAIVWIGMLGIAALVEFAQVATLLGRHVLVGQMIVGGIGLFFLVMGNQLSKSRPMYMVGIRTPWTLADPDVWVATHRLGGKLMMVAGLVWLIAAIGGWVGPAALPVLIGVTIVASLVPALYSWLLWRRMGQRT